MLFLYDLHNQLPFLFVFSYYLILDVKLELLINF